MRRLLPLVLLLLASSLVSCARAPETASRAEAVVYGVDDRLEVYEVPAGPIRTRAEQAVAVQLSAGALDETDPSNVLVTYSRTLGEAKNLCAGEAFADQIEPGTCSGTLIDAQHILTAGHCMESASDCRGEVIWVLGLRYQSAGVLVPLTSDDVYRCARVLGYTDDGSRDYSIVELDRPVVGHMPAPVASSPPAVGSALTLIGHPNGIPIKVAGGAVVTWMADDASFGTGTVDAFAGNSGSGIFDSVGQLVGILDRGDTDYVAAGGCSVVNVIDPPPVADGEGFTAASAAVDGYCHVAGVESPLCSCVGPCVAQPTGDECADAERIEARSQVIRGDLVAHGDFARGRCGGAGFDHFYRFTLTTTTTLTAQVDGFDSVLYLRAGCGGSELSCNDDIVADTNLGSRIERPLGAGDYVLVVDGFGPGEDSYTLTLEFGAAVGMDAGVLDAGTDAGGVDAGVDSGPTADDSGAIDLDGGGADAGSSHSTGGGCSLSATAAAPHAAFALLLLAGVVALRRRG